MVSMNSTQPGILQPVPAHGRHLFFSLARPVALREAQMRRMAGHDDGIVDALFRFSRPVSGAYFWCPPLHAGRPDLRSLGL